MAAVVEEIITSIVLAWMMIPMAVNPESPVIPLSNAFSEIQ